MCLSCMYIGQWKLGVAMEGGGGNRSGVGGGESLARVCMCACAFSAVGKNDNVNNVKAFLAAAASNSACFINHTLVLLPCTCV